MQRISWYQWVIDRPWIIEIFVAIVVLILLNVVLKQILKKLQNKANLKQGDWRYHIDYAALTPARVLLWIFLLSILFDLLARQFALQSWFIYEIPIRNAAIILCVTWFLIRWKNVVHTIVANREDHQLSSHVPIDSFTLEVIGKVFTVLVLFISLVIVMQLFGLNVMPLITFGGIGAAAIGFAGKDAISNFFGGLMIYLSRPFIINDTIELASRNILGNVEEIGWYFTSIRDMQKKPIYVPNSVFSTEPLINHARITHRRIDESIGIRYADLSKLPEILANIQALFAHHTAVDRRLPIHLFLQNFGPSSVQIEVRVYIRKTRYEDFMEVRQEILLQIYHMIESAGAEIPYPITQVIVTNEEPAK